jgi:hypothetical protein
MEYWASTPARIWQKVAEATANGAASQVVEITR